MTINTVILEGYLGQDPKIIIEKDYKLANFSIGVHKFWKNQQNEYQERTSWISLACFVPNTISKIETLKKGDHVIIEGYLDSYESTDKDGKKHNNLQVKLDEIKLVSTIPNKNEQPIEAGAAANSQSSNTAVQPQQTTAVYGGPQQPITPQNPGASQIPEGYRPQGTLITGNPNYGQQFDPNSD